MIEYLTQKGIFGYLWILSFIGVLIITYLYIRKHKLVSLLKLLPHLIPTFILLFICNALASDFIGKTDYDFALILMRDMWFLVGHLIFAVILFASTQKPLKKFSSVIKKKPLRGVM